MKWTVDPVLSKDQWKCKVCSVSNSIEKSKCAACGSDNPDAIATKSAKPGSLKTVNKGTSPDCVDYPISKNNPPDYDQKKRDYDKAWEIINDCQNNKELDKFLDNLGLYEESQLEFCIETEIHSIASYMNLLQRRKFFVAMNYYDDEWSGELLPISIEIIHKIWDILTMERNLPQTKEKLLEIGFKLNGITEDEAMYLKYLSLSELESFTDILKPLVARQFKKIIESISSI